MGRGLPFPRSRSPRRRPRTPPAGSPRPPAEGGTSWDRRRRSSPPAAVGKRRPPRCTRSPRSRADGLREACRRSGHTCRRRNRRLRTDRRTLGRSRRRRRRTRSSMPPPKGTRRRSTPSAYRCPPRTTPRRRTASSLRTTSRSHRSRTGRAHTRCRLGSRCRSPSHRRSARAPRCPNTGPLRRTRPPVVCRGMLPFRCTGHRLRMACSPPCTRCADRVRSSSRRTCRWRRRIA